tara:strand:- start:727 stop:1902 length:1176 start_codon:yes stop_codon:yes gene_type:complete
MKVFSAVLENGESIRYIDRKRYWWLLSVLYPLQPFASIYLHFRTGNEVWLLLPLFIAYVINPILDHLVGKDSNNPPKAVVEQLEEDDFYRILTVLVVPFHVASLVGTAWWAGTQELSWWAFIGLAISAGLNSGLAINTGHELGHKKTKLERTLAKIALAVPIYGHFSIDHNRGHHTQVATPNDHASARMGENIYKFAFREIPGGFHRAWQIERSRLQRKDLPVWHRDNQVLESIYLGFALQLLLLYAFGWKLIPFLVLHNVCAWWQLTSANYVEHYGLLRKKVNTGQYEQCKPHHSWNSNHLFSNLVLFHLERHSNHHVYPMRRYQSLRHDANQPALPTGYFGSYLLAWIPPLWYSVMHPKLLALPHIKGELSKVNIDPAQKEALFRQYGG